MHWKETISQLHLAIWNPAKHSEYVYNTVSLSLITWKDVLKVEEVPVRERVCV